MTSDAAPSRRAAAIIEWALAIATVAYVVVFAWRQTPGLFDRRILEWDARAYVLPAWRFHGTGLFAHDLVVDAAAHYEPPLWTAIYWLGTLATDPAEVSKLLPFALLAVVVWHGWALGRRFGGVPLACATVVALVHCTFVWNRMVGGNARGFGIALVVVFVRYAAEGAERRALATLVLQAAAYPAALAFCGPAYGLTLLKRRDRRAWLRFFAAGALAVAVAAPRLWNDPRLGSPPTRAQAATLRLLQVGSEQPFYPLPPAHISVIDTLEIPFRPDGDRWKGVPNGEWLAWALFVLAAVAARRRLRELPPIFAALPIACAILFGVAWAVAYRLYLPSRMLQYGWPAVTLLAAPAVVALALQRRFGARAPLVAALACIGVLLVVCGDGLPRVDNLTDFRRNDTPMVRACRALPIDAMVATHPERASYLQTFARRRVLFSASTNMPFYYRYALEIDRRMDAFYRAYYSRSLDDVRAFARRFGVTHLIVDLRDFGPRARERADYYEPWKTLVFGLLAAMPPGSEALAHPPPGSVLFADGPQLLIDARRL